VTPPLTQGCDHFRSNAYDLRFALSASSIRSSMIGELQRTSSRPRATYSRCLLLASQ
jgi:hypothetical protein